MFGYNAISVHLIHIQGAPKKLKLNFISVVYIYIKNNVNSKSVHSKTGIKVMSMK